VKDSVYFLPLALAWEDEEEQMKRLSLATVARVRQQANVGVIADAVADEGFCRHVVKAIGERRALATKNGALKFTPTSVYAEIVPAELASLHVGRLQSQSTNSSVQLGEQLFLKCYRRVRPGVHAELEIGRFLTEVAHFKHCVPLAGTVEYVAAGAEPAAVALLQSYVPNQGDGWSYTLSYLERFLKAPRADEPHGAYLTLVQTLATRTADLHRALATPSGNPAFEPEPLTPQDVAAWKQRVREEAAATFARLEKSQQGGLQPVLERIDTCAAPSKPTFQTRHHGDYHLGQVLLANNDFLIIDFEGEPSRPLAESRRKRSPLRDVAGMLRSFAYAKGAALLNAAQPSPERSAADLDAWEAAARKAFLTAYAEAMRGSGIFDSFDDVRGLLELAEIEKLLYELRYELDNRPAWLRIPLQGLAALTARPPTG
jgi:maltose alpha-D-glucosyltransferase/alpha-amylase